MNQKDKKLINDRDIKTRAVVGYLLSPDQKVILGLRKKVSMGLGSNLISGIGGKVGDIPGLEDETDEEALIREVDEEIGVKVLSYKKAAEITFMFPQKPNWSQHVIGFIVDSWDGEPKETDVIKPSFYPIDDLPFSQMWDDNQYWVPMLLKGEEVIGEFVFNDDNSTVAQMRLEKTSF